NIGVAKSMLGEITDRTNQTKAFSLFGFCWGIGCIGPAIGGYLSNPVDNYPQVFGNCIFLKTYPYFLPCAIAALISLIGFVIGYFKLPETRNRTDRNQDLERKTLS
ncbi:11905_t:CDS:2, partial [Acaulospora morrowiae]